MPSIVHVQNSCITTLNDLLSNTSQWRPIIPDRRHSMPPRSPASPNFSAQPSSSLYIYLGPLTQVDCDHRAQSKGLIYRANLFSSQILSKKAQAKHLGSLGTRLTTLSPAAP